MSPGTCPWKSQNDTLRVTHAHRLSERRCTGCVLNQCPGATCTVFGLLGVFCHSSTFNFRAPCPHKHMLLHPQIASVVLFKQHSLTLCTVCSSMVTYGHPMSVNDFGRFQFTILWHASCQPQCPLNYTLQYFEFLAVQLRCICM